MFDFGVRLLIFGSLTWTTTLAATTSCRQWSVFDDMSKLDKDTWTLDSGSEDQLDFSEGYLNMTVSERGGDNVVIATRRTFLPPASFEATFLPANVQGIVSPLIFKASGENTDEIDIEFTGLQPNDLQTVLWKDGLRLQFEIDEVPGLNPMSGFHTYKLDWTDSKVTVSVNGQVVRTHTPNSMGWPMTAMPFKFGPWANANSPGWAGTLDWNRNPRAHSAIKNIRVSGCRPNGTVESA